MANVKPFGRKADKVTDKQTDKQTRQKLYAHDLSMSEHIILVPQNQLLSPLYKKRFENIVENGENDSNQHFLLFPQCFLPFPKQISIFQSHLFCCLHVLSIWTSPKCVVG